MEAHPRRGQCGLVPDRKPVRPAPPEDPRSRIGRAIRKRRHELGISIEELASKAGINWRYLSDVELGKRNVAVVNIEKLSLALGVTPSTLFREYGGDPPDYNSNQRSSAHTESTD